jgi:hypothetical protein
VCAFFLPGRIEREPVELSEAALLLAE